MRNIMKATALLGVLLLLCGCSSEPKSNWPSEPLTETAVKAALAKVDDFMIYELDEDDILKYITCKDGAITISIKPDSIWDETHFAKQVAYSIVGYSEVLFKHPEVKQVKLSAYLEFIDKMGKSTEELAAMILWTDAGREVSYDGFSDLLLTEYKRAYDVAQDYYFHPAIRAKLNGWTK